jgi:two-component system OmpR family sensor kinase/two-component system sensor histidine kinase QseC
MNSIRVRLLLWLLATLAAAALLMGALTYRGVLAETEALFDYQLRQMALSLRDQGEVAPGQARALADGELDFVVQIWTVDGRGIYASRAHSSLPERAALGFADITAEGKTWRTFGVATRDRVIQVAQPRQIRRQLAADAALHSVAPLLLVAPVLALAMWWLAAGTLAPLRRLTVGLRERDEQSLQPLSTSGLPVEVAPLVAALNGLLQRLGESLDTQRAFVSDAAHELRSPLTALSLQLQLLRRAPDAAARSAAIDALGAGIDRAGRLVEQLLTLARSEPGAPLAMVLSLDLSELVREAVADTVPLALVRGASLELFADAPVRVRGEAAALAMLARNLADNAVRHSPRGARVELRVFADGGVPTLQVDDAGPGIPLADRERVFDRFYRRASDDEAGSGLGLAIVRSVASRHGATVSLADSRLGGLRVTVQFSGNAAMDATPRASGLPTLPGAAPTGAVSSQDTIHRGDP